MQCVSELIEKLELLIRSAWRSIISNTWGHRRPWQQKEGTKKTGESVLASLPRATCQDWSSNIASFRDTFSSRYSGWNLRHVGTFLTGAAAKAHLPPSQCRASGRRGRSPRRTETLTFPLSGSQERLFGCLKSHLFFSDTARKSREKQRGRARWEEGSV